MRKRNKILIITSIIFVVIGIASLMIGYAISGADVWGWFSSKWAMLVYIFLGLYALLVLFIFAGDWIRRM